MQPHLKGQYHNEIVAGAQREVMEDLVLGIDYTHRWLGNVIEDGTAADGTFMLANPGNVPPEAITAYQNQITQYTAQVSPSARWTLDNATTDAAKATAQAALDHAQNDLAGAQSLLGNLKGLADRAQARAHLRRAHVVRRQALLEAVAGSRVVHLLALDR